MVRFLAVAVTCQGRPAETPATDDPRGKEPGSDTGIGDYPLGEPGRCEKVPPILSSEINNFITSIEN